MAEVHGNRTHLPPSQTAHQVCSFEPSVPNNANYLKFTLYLEGLFGLIVLIALFYTYLNIMSYIIKF